MPVASPLDVPGLVCFWPFAPGADGDLSSLGPNRFTLREMNGPIARVGVGVFGDTCLAIERGQWLCLPAAECPQLNFSGRRQVSVVAWVQRRTDNIWQYIAGVWDERNERRQYALFTSGHKQAHWQDLSRADADHQPHGYVSDVGGATPGCPFCFSYATGNTRVEAGRWTTLGFAYDGNDIRVYTDGRLDGNGQANPFRWEKPLFDPGDAVPDFTVAQRSVPSWPDYPRGQPGNIVGFGGLLAGLAVYERALTAEQFATLHATPGANATPTT